MPPDQYSNWAAVYGAMMAHQMARYAEKEGRFPPPKVVRVFVELAAEAAELAEDAFQSRQDDLEGS